MSVMASQITGVSIVSSAGCLDADQRKNQSSASLAVVGGILRWPVDSPHKGPVARKMFRFDGVINLNVSTAKMAAILSQSQCVKSEKWQIFVTMFVLRHVAE